LVEIGREGGGLGLADGEGFGVALRVAAWLVLVASLCSVGALGLVVRSRLRQGMVVGVVVARGWPIQAAVVGHLREKSLLRLWPELAMAAAAVVAYFLGSIVVRCAHYCACGLDSGGKPLIRDRAMEALLCLVLVGGIVSESPAARVSGVDGGCRAAM
jgi:hypothetical protein